MAVMAVTDEGNKQLPTLEGPAVGTGITDPLGQIGGSRPQGQTPALLEQLASHRFSPRLPS
jgi:hypothetical protein